MDSIKQVDISRLSWDSIYARMAKDNLLDFTTYTFKNYKTNWHHEVMCRYLEKWVKGDIKRLMVFLPPRSGKKIGNIPVFTTNGWKNHDNLQIGDIVFTKCGKQTKIVAVVDDGDPIDLLVTFTNGEQIKAHRNHEWLVYDRRYSNKKSYKGKVYSPWRILETNKFLNSTLHYEEKSGSKIKTRHRFGVPNVSALEFDAKELPIDPYFLGAWLGDGDSDCPRICYAVKNGAVIDKCMKCGYDLGYHHIHKTTGIHYQYFKNMISKIRELNLINNKHIPEIYKFSSIEQRLELIAGLIDTDGSVDKNGRVSFSNCNKKLIDDYVELAYSLGFRPYIQSITPAHESSSGITGTKTVYVVGFNPTMKIPTVLPQKQVTRLIKQRMIYIDKVEVCDPVPGKCIRVDSPDGVYLVGKSLIPTHNSELVSRRLPAWIFGRDPDASIISASYSMDLAGRMNRDVQRIIDSDEYKRVFPDTSLFAKNIRTTAHGAYLRNVDIFEIVNHKGVYKTAGIGGGLTGMGFNYGIIDDPVKDRQEAESKTIQDNVWDWYTSVFYTRRMTDDSRILITLTRWNVNDLAGKLIELSKNDPNADQWTILSLPMIAEEPLHPDDPRKLGDPLWPERFSMESLIATRSVMGPYDWAALMQQNPIASGGTVFNRGWLTKYYDDDPHVVVDNMQEVLQSWDMTNKEGSKSDFVVGQVWGRKGADKYLLDQVRFQGDFVQTIEEFRKLSNLWPTSRRKLVEEAANGYGIISSLKHEISGILPVKPMGGKVVRAMAVTPDFEAGNIYLPRPNYAPWIHDWIEEMAMFPNVKHDDQCFVAGTMIATDNGSVPIEDIKVGDYVIVPGGKSKVVSAGCTGYKDIVSNCGLVGTASHPVFSKRKGFICLDKINENEVDYLCLKNVIKWTYLKLLYLMESSTNLWERESIILVNQIQMKDEDMLKDFMLRFMSFIREKQYQKGMLFIIKMETLLTTNLKTWYAYHEMNMQNYIKQKMLKNKWNISHGLENLQRYGINQKKENNGIETMLRNKQKIEENLILFVDVVESILNLFERMHYIVLETAHKKISIGEAESLLKEYVNIVEKNLNMMHIQEMYREEELESAAVDRTLLNMGKVPVYNLTVDESHVYYANNILVSNCDAATQAIFNMKNRSSVGVPFVPKVVPIGKSEVEQLFTPKVNSRHKLSAPPFGARKVI